MISILIMYPDSYASRRSTHAWDDDRTVDQWLLDKRPSTRRAYGTDLSRIAALIQKPLESLMREDLPRLQWGLRTLRSAVRMRTTAALNSYLAYLDTTGVGSPIPFHRLRVPRPQRRPPTTVPAAVIERAIITEPVIRNQLLLALFYESGVRPSEIASLRWHHLWEDFYSGRVIFLPSPKGRMRRTMPISRTLWEMLQAYRRGADAHDLVFRSTR